MNIVSAILRSFKPMHYSRAIVLCVASIENTYKEKAALLKKEKDSNLNQEIFAASAAMLLWGLFTETALGVVVKNNPSLIISVYSELRGTVSLESEAIAKKLDEYCEDIRDFKEFGLKTMSLFYERTNIDPEQLNPLLMESLLNSGTSTLRSLDEEFSIGIRGS